MNVLIFWSFVIVTPVLFVVWYTRRRERLREAENEIRDSLGLPRLTRSQFDIEVEEPSRENGMRINQHM